jgi:hypothetical protein
MLSQLTRQEYREIIKLKDEFIRLSLKYMKEKDRILESKGLDPAKYWNFVQLPDWLLKKYEKGGDGTRKIRSLGANPDSPSAIKRRNIMIEIDALHAQGLSNIQIATRVGMSAASVSYWLKEIRKQK